MKENYFDCGFVSNEAKATIIKGRLVMANERRLKGATVFLVSGHRSELVKTDNDNTYGAGML